MANGGFISPLRTTLRCHLGRTSWVQGCKILIRLMMLWMVSSCMGVGGFIILRTLAMEEQCTFIVFTCLFSAKRWTRYSARVMYMRSLDCIPLSLAHLAKAFHWNLYTWLDKSLRGSAAISTTVLGKWCCLRISRIRATRLDPTGEDLCGTKGSECWGCTWGWRLSWSSRGCHGREGCREAMRITVVPWENLIFWRVFGIIRAGGKA